MAEDGWRSSRGGRARWSRSHGHRFTGGERIDGGKRGLGHRRERLDRNGRRTTRPNRLDERSHASAMTLVLGQLPGLAHAPVAPEGQRPEVLQNGRGAVAQDFQALLARGRVASGHVGDGGERTIAESNGDRDVVIARCAGSRRDALRIHGDWHRSREKRAKIDEVASLADDPAAADRGIVDPRVRRNLARVHAVVHDERRPSVLEERRELPRERREAAVEPDSEDPSGRGMRREHLEETWPIDGKRLLDEDVLLRAKARARLCSVLIVTGDHEDRIDLGMLEDGRGVRRARLEAILVGQMPRGKPAAGGNRDEAGAAGGSERGHQRSGGECACADHANLDGSLDGTRDGHRDGPRRRGLRRIFEEHTERITASDQLICLLRAFDREAVADQALDPNGVDGALVQKGLHVALLSPAHVASWIVVPEHLAARRAQELRCELADEAESDNRERLSEGGIRDADALERDRPEGDKRRGIVADGVGYYGAEMSWNKVHLGMVRRFRTSAGNAVADGYSRDTVAHCEHTPSAAVPQGDRLLELVQNGSSGREQTVE